MKNPYQFHENRVESVDHFPLQLPKVPSLFSCSFINFPTLNNNLAAGDVTTWEKSPPNYCTASVIYSFVLIYIFLLLRCLIFIPKKVCTLPFVTANTGKISYTLLMMSQITSCSTCETLLSGNSALFNVYVLIGHIHIISIYFEPHLLKYTHV